MTLSTDGRNGHRLEKKFILPSLDATDGQRRLLLHPLGFQEIHQERKVISLYLDTPDFRLTRDHRDNASVRGKWRVRWYQDRELISPAQLEWKVRNGQSGRKEVYPLAGPAGRPPEEAQWRNHPRLHVGDWRPVVRIAYRRRYFLSRCKAVRATLDWEIHAAEPGRPDGPAWDWSLLELKYGLDTARELRHGPGQGLHPSRHSKFMIGLGRLLGMSLETL